jgi:hypothetical protein
LSRRPESGSRFWTADEVRILHRVTNKEYRGVVIHQIVVPVFRVELQTIAAHVAPSVGTALLAGDGGETRQHLGGRGLLDRRRTSIYRHIFGGLEDAERARALGVRLALGRLLAVEVCRLFQKAHVVEQDRPVGANGQRVAITGGRRAGAQTSITSIKAPRLPRISSDHFGVCRVSWPARFAPATSRREAGE